MHKFLPGTEIIFCQAHSDAPDESFSLSLNQKTFTSFCPVNVLFDQYYHKTSCILFNSSLVFKENTVRTKATEFALKFKTHLSLFSCLYNNTLIKLSKYNKIEWFKQARQWTKPHQFVYKSVSQRLWSFVVGQVEELMLQF